MTREYVPELMRYVLESPDGTVFDIEEIFRNGRKVRAAQLKVLEDLDALELSDRVSERLPRETIEIGPHKSVKRGNIPAPINVEGGMTSVNLLLTRYEDGTIVAYDAKDRENARPAKVDGVDLKTASSLPLCGVLITNSQARRGIPIELPTINGGYRTLLFRLIENEGTTQEGNESGEKRTDVLSRYNGECVVSRNTKRR